MCMIEEAGAQVQGSGGKKSEDENAILECHH